LVGAAGLLGDAAAARLGVPFGVLPRGLAATSASSSSSSGTSMLGISYAPASVPSLIRASAARSTRWSGTTTLPSPALSLSL